MDPQEGCEEVELDSSKDEEYNGPPDAELAGNGSSELTPKSALGCDDSSEGPYKGRRIVEWWQDVNKPEQGWWVKVRVDGQYKWVPHQEVSSPSPKRQRSEDGAVNGS